MKLPFFPASDEGHFSKRISENQIYYPMKISLKIVALLFLAGQFVACQSATTTADQNTEETMESSSAPAENNEYAGEAFGADFAPAEVVSYPDLLSEMAGQDSMYVTLRGTVSEVCQAKGCWMNIVGTEDGSGMMVRFKDYGFFVPKDISGREVVMEGVAFNTVTPVEELRHYAEDAGKSEEEIAAITEPKEELAFLASGVIVLEE